MTYESNGGRHARNERTQRQLRVGELIRHSLVEILTRGVLRDPDLSGVSITVSEVRISPDLRNATAFVMPLGGKDSKKISAALKRAAPYLRRLVGSKVKMRYMPNLNFVEDSAFDEGEKITALLRSSKISADIFSTNDETDTSKN